MAVFLSPGVFIEEVSTQAQVVEAVGTSTMAIVGFTKQGPVEDPQVVTSSNDFGRRFGGFTKPEESLVPHSVSAFFANGGSRAFIVRVVPTDAVAADSCIDEAVVGEALGAGDGSSPQTIAATMSNLPLRPGTVTVRWRNNPSGTVSGEDPAVVPAENGIVTNFTVTMLNSPMTNMTLVINWDTIGPTARTANIDGEGVGTLVSGTDAAEISSASLDRDTGVLSIVFVTAPLTDSIRVDYDFAGPEQSTVDDGAGAFSETTSGGTVITGTVDYDTGDVSVTWTGAADAPYDGDDVVVDYGQCLWNLDAANEGAWGNNLKLELAGNRNFFTYGTQATTGAGTYSKFDVTIFQTDEISGEDVVRETFEELVFDDVDDPLYFSAFLNDNSDFVVVEDLNSLTVPSTFAGVAVSGEVMGAGTGALLTFTGTLAGAPIVQTSLEITYTTGATNYTLAVDLNGNVSGTGLDTTETNLVDLTDGSFELNFLGGFAPDAATNITADYISEPETSTVTYEFINGSDGTLPLGTTDMTSPALEANLEGMYALNRVDEIFQLVIPDLAGDEVAAGQQLDFAESRNDVFVILNTPSGLEAQEAADWKRITFPRRSKKASVYWPWVTIADPLVENRTITVPNMPHIAGIYARVDSTRNVGKAPGGTVDGAIRGIIGLENSPGQVERDIVYPARINPLINTPQTGLAVWGVRSISPNNDIFRYVHAARLFMFVEKSIFNSTQGFLFENINTSLYTSIKATVDGFLMNLFNTNHFAGESPDQAFFSICDSTNNPPEVVNAGQIIVDVGIAPNRPGEFIRFRFAVKTLDAS